MKRHALHSALLLLLVALAAPARGDHSRLRTRLRQSIAGEDARIGIGIVFDGRDTVSVNDGICYPMMSVFKFHQALAVGDYLARHDLSTDSPIEIFADDLPSGTHSPLRDRYTAEGMPHPFVSDIGELLGYTLRLSDNNACDILFDRTEDPASVDRYIRRLGIERFAVVRTEQEMHERPECCRDNWTSPLEAARLLELFLTDDRIAPAYRDFIRRTMIGCRTGEDRLPRPLRKTGAVIGHKTGTGDRDEEGRIAGFNDIGFVFLPDGRRYTIAVLITDASGSMEHYARLIAELSAIVYEYFSENEGE